MKSDIVILIPAYNPDEKLVKLLEELINNKYKNIVVVNDGSKNSEIWKNINSEIIILTHKENKGKGQALKTGFKYCLNKYSNINGVITMDADGQHLVKDVNKIYESIKENSDSIILGCRNFYDKKVPLTSKIGNIFFRKLFKLRTRQKITDTQTGLRGFPFSIIKEILMVEGDRFDYETKVLFKCVELKLKIIEVSIETVYINKNESSHFNKIKDSLDVCKTVIKK